MPSIYSVIFIAMGGALGSIFRYLLSASTQTISKSIDFPYGTLTVNLIGCFVIGFLAQLAETRGVFTSNQELLYLLEFWADLPRSLPLEMKP